jgi:hypothetical protein
MYGSMRGTIKLEFVSGDETGGSITELMQKHCCNIPFQGVQWNKMTISQFE